MPTLTDIRQMFATQQARNIHIQDAEVPQEAPEASAPDEDSDVVLSTIIAGYTLLSAAGKAKAFKGYEIIIRPCAFGKYAVETGYGPMDVKAPLPNSITSVERVDPIFAVRRSEKFDTLTHAWNAVRHIVKSKSERGYTATINLTGE